MPCVVNKPIMLSVIMLNVVMLNFVMLNVVMLSIIMLYVVAPVYDRNRNKVTLECRKRRVAFR